jgi:hypothetical protein
LVHLLVPSTQNSEHKEKHIDKIEVQSESPQDREFDKLTFINRVRHGAAHILDSLGIIGCQTGEQQYSGIGNQIGHSTASEKHIDQ